MAQRRKRGEEEEEGERFSFRSGRRGKKWMKQKWQKRDAKVSEENDVRTFLG